MSSIQPITTHPSLTLANLDAEGLLDLNPFSASQDDLSITMSSSKAAASSSYAVSADLKASVNVMGIVGGSAAAHYEHSMALANSDGNVYVTMTRGRHRFVPWRHGRRESFLCVYRLVECDRSPYDFGTGGASRQGR